ncbi:MAG: ATP-dependent DNA helicase RecG [Acidobacteria bacterium]|nr:ATP-dependent DNA helicase RecG [Acidobacteriota bacterium]
MEGISPYLKLEDLKFRGLGPVTVKRLAAKGLHRVEDVLYFFPIHYNDLTVQKQINELIPGETATLHVRINSRQHRMAKNRRLAITEALVSDETGSIRITWFNQPYLANTLKTGMELLIYGKLETGRNGPGIINPTFRILDPKTMLSAKPVIEPVYSAVERVSNRFLQGLARTCIEGVLPCNFQVPENLIAARGFPDKRTCFNRIHFPEDSSSVRDLESFNSPYQLALVYEELFLFFAGILAVRRKLTATKKDPVVVRPAEKQNMLELLPFQLTGEQQRVIDGIYREFEAGRRLVRLVQGDVGSGKTVVALLSAMPFLTRGGQAAFMAPTELLAEQHYNTLNALLSGTGIEVRLLTGSIGTKAAREIRKGLRDGTVLLVVGTHALIQPEIIFRKLEFVIIDEQHRFGVAHREELVRKGEAPHILSLTATPIPRTLAMTLYGQYDYDAIRGLPAGRKPVRTVVKKEENIYEVYEFVRKMIRAKGLQAYFVFPLIEESEKMDLKSAETVYEELKNGFFTGFRTALVHGRVKNEERRRVMDAFKEGEIDILFATTVIEVGVDVANANIMVIHNSERFGLSQLHQLRGRIGRGGENAYCFLVVKELKGDTAYRRVRMMARSSDGFMIAEEDLKIRGPGEFLGTRQSGMPAFRVADIMRDRDVVQMARKDAQDAINRGLTDFLTPEEWRDRFGKSLV